MIHLAVREVKPEHLDLFRDWMKQLDGPRRAEALATLDDEGCAHEVAVLIEGPAGPLVIFAMEVDSIERSREAANDSTHSIDAEHRAILDLAIGDRPPFERILNLHR